MGSIDCPFCAHEEDNEHSILRHLESAHPEHIEPVERPQIAAHLPTESMSEESMAKQYDSIAYVECPFDCGEVILDADMDSHLDLHSASQDVSTGSIKDMPVPKRAKTGTTSDTSGSIIVNPDESTSEGECMLVKAKVSQSPNEKRKMVSRAWQSILHMPNILPVKASNDTSISNDSSAPKRLGKKELGPYAHEAQMPEWLHKLLNEKDGHTKTIKRTGTEGKTRNVEFSPNHTTGVVPVIAQLLEQDSRVSYAYICHPMVAHVSKLFREGGFCGYRNIQCLISYIIASKSQGYPHFNDHIPTIFKIQDWIEKAWDLGINKQGRVETGGVKGTRKYIGTPEAQAMFLGLDISCNAEGLKAKGQQRADEILRNVVERYFESGRQDRTQKVRRTMLPPLYFQHPGHSLTIIGFEKLKDGTSNLLVFDPMFGDSSSITKHIGQKFKERAPGDRLKAYRRGDSYLKKFKEFEILRLTPPF